MNEKTQLAIAADDGPIVGVLGGMGPAATADFFTKLVAVTPAQVDQEHLRVLVWSDPLVPDRSAALLDHSPDPSDWLIRGAKLLAAGGARLIAVPCNTAHAFLGSLERRAGVEIVHMIDQTASYVAALTPPVRRVGLLATAGTLRTRLYEGWLSPQGIGTLTPTASEQEILTEAIRMVKAGSRETEISHAIARVSEHLVDRGAQALIAGCTEIPLVFRQSDASVPVIDPTLVLAHAVVATVAERQGRERFAPA